MKLTYIAAALAASALSAGAFAAQPAPHNPLPIANPTVEMYFSGSTAADPIIRGFMAKNCDANTLDAYRADVSTGSTQYLYVCTSAAGFGGATGPKGTIIVHKSGTSSSDGVTPPATSAVIPYLAQADVVAQYNSAPGGGANFPGSVIPANGVINAYNYYIAPVGAIAHPTGSVVPDIGFSDVEPTLLAAPSVTSQLAATPDYLLIFGVPVTVAARNALQTAQGIAPVGDASTQPTLTVSDLASIYTGKVTDLGAFDAAAGTIFIGRRSGGSGTTKTFDKTFAGAVCAGSDALTAPVSTAGSAACTGAAGTRIVQMGTTEDMQVCMNNFQAAGVYAFGEMSTDYQPAAGDGYRYIRINGFSPTQLNTTEGAYPLWAEGSLNVNATTFPSGTAAQQAAKTSIKSLFISETGNPTTVSAINTTLPATLNGFPAGLMVLNSNSAAIGNFNVFPLTLAEVKANPASQFGQGGNSCTHPYSNSGSDPADPTGVNGFIPE